MIELYGMILSILLAMATMAFTGRIWHLTEEALMDDGTLDSVVDQLEPPEEMTVDRASGKKIRRTDNGLKDCDIVSPSMAAPLEIGDDGLPTWWTGLKAKRGDI